MMTLAQRASVLSATTLALLLGVASPAAAVPITYYATLTGAAEAPPNASTGTGTATVIFDDVAHTLSVEVHFSGLTAPVSAAHIHCCTPVQGDGTAGVATQTPSFFAFPAASSGDYLRVFDLTDAASFRAAFITANGGTVAGAEAALGAGLFAGKAYLNLHTATFPGGEIRGFLVPEPGALALLAAGVVGLGVFTRRRPALRPVR